MFSWISAAIIAAAALGPASAQDRKPDLNGVWDFRTITPLERPESHAGKAVLSDQEAAEFEARTAARRVDRKPRPGSVGGYNQFWFEWGTKVLNDKRSSLIVDPADGRVPPLRGREENLLSRRRAGAPSARQAQRCRTPPLPKPQLLRLDS